MGACKNLNQCSPAVLDREHEMKVDRNVTRRKIQIGGAHVRSF